METKMITFFNNELEKHTYIRSRTLAMNYMVDVLNMKCDCRKGDTQKISEIRKSIIIKFSKLMKIAILNNRIKKHNSSVYKVINK